MVYKQLTLWWLYSCMNEWPVHNNNDDDDGDVYDDDDYDYSIKLLLMMLHA
jgi:hypothetical protein